MGKIVTHELVPGGKAIAVNSDNKYVCLSVFLSVCICVCVPICVSLCMSVCLVSISFKRAVMSLMRFHSEEV